MDNVNVVGKHMLEDFERIKRRNANVEKVRGMGLFGAISLEKVCRSAEPLGPKVVAKALEKGLICCSGTCDGQDILAFAPPLIITKNQMDDMITIVNESIKAVK